MKSDRELLELAAKAAGVELKYYTYGQGENPDRVYYYWNPLTDDGDALRLAVKLHLDVSVGVADVIAETRRDSREAYELTGIDPYAATRRAIVRAAAEIGGAM